MNEKTRSILLEFERVFPTEYDGIFWLCIAGGGDSNTIIEEFVKLCEKYAMWDKVGSSYFDAKNILEEIK